jgi:predicted metal-dependent hydrolase
MPRKSIVLAGQEIEYELISSRKARKMRIEIGVDGLKVVKPVFVPFIIIEQFIKSRGAWIIKNLATMSKHVPPPVIPKDEMVVLKRRAAHLILARLEFYNQQYGFKYKSLSVRDQKTRWGSCSRQGALNFNCRLALLPERLLDYVAVHELCHLKEMNHSLRFWKLVERTIPDYNERRKELHRFNL